MPGCPSPLSAVEQMTPDLEASDCKSFFSLSHLWMQSLEMSLLGGSDSRSFQS